LKDKIIMHLENDTKSEAEVRYNENDIVLLVNEEETVIEIKDVASCKTAKNNDTICILKTKNKDSYTLEFTTAAKANRFCVNVTADMGLPVKKGEKKLPVWAWVVLIVGVVAVVTAVTASVVLKKLLTKPEDPTETSTAATSATQEPVVYEKDNVKYLDNYSIDAVTPDDAIMKAGVAFDADGNAVLTNQQLQIQYWMIFYQFMNQYSSYAAYFGLDYTQPLAQQTFYDGSCTWEQYFLENAQAYYTDYYTLYMLAKEDNYVLPQEWQDVIDDVLKADGDFYTEATTAGYETTDAYVKAQFGDGVDTKAYAEYLQMYYTAMSYFDEVLGAKATANVDDSAIENYYEENKESFEASGVYKYNNVSVRHILIQPINVEDASASTWTDDEWKIAEETANEIYAQWKDDPTEEKFVSLANQYSVDPGNGTDDTGKKGGIYEDFGYGKMVTEFNDWCFDQSRQTGDTGIVKTTYGYHIMYFVEQTATREWYDTAKNQLENELVNAAMNEYDGKYPITFDYSQVKIFDLLTATANEG